MSPTEKHSDDDEIDEDSRRRWDAWVQAHGGAEALEREFKELMIKQAEPGRRRALLKAIQQYTRDRTRLLDEMSEVRGKLRVAISQYAGSPATPTVIAQVRAELPAIRSQTREEGRRRVAETVEAVKAGKGRLERRFVPVSSEEERRRRQEEERTRTAMEKFRAWMIANDPAYRLDRTDE